MTGLVQRGAWTPPRAELERVLLDDEWHSVASLVARCAPLVDPRVAAHQWFRNHRVPRRDDESITQRFASNERAAVARGRQMVVEDLIRTLVREGRLEIHGLRARTYKAMGAAHVRVAPTVRERERYAEQYCFHGHRKPDSGWPNGKRKNCLVCSRIRNARRYSTPECQDAAD